MNINVILFIYQNMIEILYKVYKIFDNIFYGD